MYFLRKLFSFLNVTWSHVHQVSAPVEQNLSPGPALHPTLVWLLLPSSWLQKGLTFSDQAWKVASLESGQCWDRGIRVELVYPGFLSVWQDRRRAVAWTAGVTRSGTYLGRGRSSMTSSTIDCPIMWQTLPSLAWKITSGIACSGHSNNICISWTYK